MLQLEPHLVIKTKLGRKVSKLIGHSGYSRYVQLQMHDLCKVLVLYITASGASATLPTFLASCKRDLDLFRLLHQSAQQMCASFIVESASTNEHKCCC